MKITILSISCCNPALKGEDEAYRTRVEEVLGQMNVPAQVNVMTITEAMSAMNDRTVAQLRPLVNKFGMSILPALLIDDDLALYGGIPTAEKMSEVIKKHAGRV
ncbi:MAG: hypothetical protein A4E32_01386 [Methanomassiliicoccales archaeon PtaU1.Bin124]|nr:MAG: hypothetical protein A4E32_01386 [Methanomassiliicoccales archaeon PtaU1.Bin124]